ncbi:MAG: hypothetical protein BWY63_03673 [Chloroflexi bacterium ADurb.Bin360]|nr:MAG: hypothetical protein BWY63_03673 [Chloroflexi bacterium ADurb.Bin360]
MLIEHVDRIVAPAPVFLPHQALQVAIFQPFEFDGERIENDGCQLPALRRLLPHRHGTALGEQGPQPYKEPSIQIGVFCHHFFDHLHTLVDIVIAVDRGHDFDVGIRFERLTKPARAFLEVEGAGNAAQQRYLALGAHEAHQQFRGSFAALVVVHTQVGDALAVR